MNDYKPEPGTTLVSTQVTEMEFMFNIISALIYCNIMSFASSYYTYDDTPNRLVSKVSGVTYAKCGALHKKRYTGNISRKFMRSPADYAIDSHFSVMKSPPMTFDQVQSWNARDRKVVKITEAYKTGPETNELQDERPRREPNSKSFNVHRENNNKVDVREAVNIRKDSRFDPKHIDARLESKNKENVETRQIQNENPFLKGNNKDRHGMYQTKLNVNKISSSNSPKDLKLNNSRATSVSHIPNHYRRIPVAEQSVGKTELYSVRSAPSNHVLEAISRKMTNSKQYNSKKRETGVVAKTETPPPITRNNIPKDVGRDHFTGADAGRIGGSEVHIESNDTPYAVFYRMNPVAVYEQDEILLDTIDKNSDANREKVINTAGDLMLSNHKPKLSADVKLHKKMKNFSNFKIL